MKKIFSFYLAFQFLTLFSAASPEPYKETNSLYRHLVSINSNWSYYINEEGPWAEKVAFADDHSFVETDLLLVETFLRGRDISGLSDELRAARNKNLDAFHEYILAGDFPLNYDVEGRRPCFIDKDGGVCAVGNLLVQSGKSELAYYIASEYQYAFVKEIAVSGMAEWQRTSGLSLEELALIQPSYSWKRNYSKAGPFQAGPVYSMELLAFNTGKNIFSLRPQSYRHLFSYAYGVEVTRNFKSKNSFIQLGCLMTNENMLFQMEGEFGALQQYGKIISLINAQYISLPLRVGFSESNSGNRTLFALGYRADLFQDLHSNSISFGAVSPLDIAANTFSKGDYKKLRSSISFDAGYEKYFKLKKGSIWLKFYPGLDFMISPEQKGNDLLPYKPIVLHAITALEYDFATNSYKIKQRQDKRKARRAERKMKKQMRKEKKHAEKELKEKLKEEKKNNSGNGKD